jgi:hypothetical protein
VQLAASCAVLLCTGLPAAEAQLSPVCFLTEGEPSCEGGRFCCAPAVQNNMNGCCDINPDCMCDETCPNMLVLGWPAMADPCHTARPDPIPVVAADGECDHSSGASCCTVGGAGYLDAATPDAGWGAEFKVEDPPRHFRSIVWICHRRIDLPAQALAVNCLLTLDPSPYEASSRFWVARAGGGVLRAERAAQLGSARSRTDHAGVCALFLSKGGWAVLLFLVVLYYTSGRLCCTKSAVRLDRFRTAQWGGSDYFVHVHPCCLEAGAGCGLVLQIHGYTNSAATMEATTDLAGWAGAKSGQISDACGSGPRQGGLTWGIRRGRGHLSPLVLPNFCLGL